MGSKVRRSIHRSVCVWGGPLSAILKKKDSDAIAARGTSQAGSYRKIENTAGSAVPERAGAWPGHGTNEKKS